MKQFDVLERSDEIQLVKRGFSWPGFFFTWAWAFSRRLPLQGSLLLVGFALLVVLPDSLPEEHPFARLAHAAWFAAALVTGAFGNGWRSHQLQRDGFTPVETIEATSHTEAAELVGL